MAKRKSGSFGTRITNWLLFVFLNIVMIIGVIAILGGLLGKIWRSFDLAHCPNITVIHLSWGSIIAWAIVVAVCKNAAESIK